MNLHNARDLAVKLMREHGLQGWNFHFDNAKRRFGYCSYTRKEIGISAPLASLNDETRVKNTILHEIAHGVARIKYGNRIKAHGWEWRSEARALGCDAKRCYEDEAVNQPKGKYVAVCPNCGKKSYANKMGNRMRSGKQSCGDCCRKYNWGRWSDKYLLIWKINR